MLRTSSPYIGSRMVKVKNCHYIWSCYDAATFANSVHCFKLWTCPVLLLLPPSQIQSVTMSVLCALAHMFALLRLPLSHMQCTFPNSEILWLSFAVEGGSVYGAIRYTGTRHTYIVCRISFVHRFRASNLLLHSRIDLRTLCQDNQVVAEKVE